MSTQNDAIIQHQFAVKSVQILKYGKHASGEERAQSGDGKHRCDGSVPCLHVICARNPYMKVVEY